VRVSFHTHTHTHIYIYIYNLFLMYESIFTLLYPLSNGSFLSILCALFKISCGLCEFACATNFCALHHELFCSFSKDSFSQLAHLFLLQEVVSSSCHEPLPFIPRMFHPYSHLAPFCPSLGTFCMCLRHSTISHTTINFDTTC
jgi:hypothetical protein